MSLVYLAHTAASAKDGMRGDPALELQGEVGDCKEVKHRKHVYSNTNRVLLRLLLILSS
jgi:hypothetical protein